MHSLNNKNKLFQSEKRTPMYATTYLAFKNYHHVLYSHDKWECQFKFELSDV